LATLEGADLFWTDGLHDHDEDIDDQNTIATSDLSQSSILEESPVSAINGCSEMVEDLDDESESSESDEEFNVSPNARSVKDGAERVGQSTDFSLLRQSPAEAKISTSFGLMDGMSRSRDREEESSDFRTNASRPEAQNGMNDSSCSSEEKTSSHQQHHLCCCLVAAISIDSFLLSGCTSREALHQSLMEAIKAPMRLGGSEKLGR